MVSAGLQWSLHTFKSSANLWNAQYILCHLSSEDTTGLSHFERCSVIFFWKSLWSIFIFLRCYFPLKETSHDYRNARIKSEIQHRQNVKMQGVLKEEKKRERKKNCLLSQNQCSEGRFSPTYSFFFKEGLSPVLEHSEKIHSEAATESVQKSVMWSLVIYCSECQLMSHKRSTGVSQFNTCPTMDYASVESTQCGFSNHIECELVPPRHDQNCPPVTSGRCSEVQVLAKN